mmetsp:Transcript_20099/g.34614  ORF Transcript_20099/g.34614 Transcript_20099/m.34614 type:complete len:377 (+) Transcript_20099:113-1243(+)
MYALRLSSSLKDDQQERERLESEGLNYFDVFFGPATGPRFLATAGFERAFLDTKPTRNKYFVGGSAGALRFTALLFSRLTGQDYLTPFINAYCNIRYETGDPAARITGELDKVLDVLVRPSAVDALLRDHEHRLLVFVSRIRPWSAALYERSPHAHLLSYLPFLFSNFVHPPSTPLLFERLCFYSGPTLDPAYLFRPHPVTDPVFIRLTADNFRAVLRASCSIPRIILPVTNIPGVGDGCYVDGGLGDYQLNSCVAHKPALLLSHRRSVKATWFDNFVPLRAPPPNFFQHVSVIYPTSHFLRSLPACKVPAKRDWEDLAHDPARRIRNWTAAAHASTHAFPSTSLLRNCLLDPTPAPLAALLSFLSHLLQMRRRPA